MENCEKTDCLPEFSSIGIVRTEFAERYAAPRQPGLTTTQGVIELLPHQNFEQALQDLDGFDRIWVVFCFDRNSSWKPKVLPPRADCKKGVFATRSPHRPNGIGLSCVSLLGVEGRRIMIGDHDFLDKTPVLDIKPYVVYADSFPEAKQGWIEEIETREKEEGGKYRIKWSIDSQRDADTLLRRWQIDLMRKSRYRLEYAPYPSPNARIRALGKERYELAVGSWRVRYRVVEKERLVEVEEIATGYSKAVLDRHTTIEDRWNDLEMHKTFIFEKNQLIR